MMLTNIEFKGWPPNLISWSDQDFECKNWNSNFKSTLPIGLPRTTTQLIIVNTFSVLRTKNLHNVLSNLRGQNLFYWQRYVVLFKLSFHNNFWWKYSIIIFITFFYIKIKNKNTWQLLWKDFIKKYRK